MILEEQKYPIGKFQKPDAYTSKAIAEYIATLEAFPAKIKKEVEHLTNEQLDTQYRAGGWTVRQVVNHCADSHINAFVRFKLALTENNPTIKPYEEGLWAKLADSETMPVAPALLTLEGLHIRWVVLIKSMTTADMKKSYFHPEQKKTIALEEVIAIYAWHCNHHLAHITTLKKAKGWK